MAATQISNPRDLLLQLLGELLYVERRLADTVIGELASSARSPELRSALEAHRTETQQHVERIERVFRVIAVAPTSNLSRSFESAVAQHDELRQAVKEPTLADVFHAQAALHVEHWEIAAYTTVLALGTAMGQGEAVGLLRDSLGDEERARDELAQATGRLSEQASAG